MSRGPACTKVAADGGQDRTPIRALNSIVCEGKLIAPTIRFEAADDDDDERDNYE